MHFCLNKAQEELYLFIRDNPGIRARYMPGDKEENAANLRVLETEGLITGILYEGKNKVQYYRWYVN